MHVDLVHAARRGQPGVLMLRLHKWRAGEPDLRSEGVGSSMVLMDPTPGNRCAWVACLRPAMVSPRSDGNAGNSGWRA